MRELVLVKLGGSAITDKSRPYTARHDVIRRLANEIHQARKKKDLDVIVGHGGGSFPHTSANEYQVHRGAINEKSWEGFSKVQNDAARLNRIIVDALISAGENAVSVQPSSSCIAENGSIVNWYLEPIKTMLKNRILPVPYGDVALDLKQGCCILSTEEILGFLARQLGSKKIIMVGKVDGVLNNKNNVIEEITPDSFSSIKKYLASSDSVDVTGGMLHKVQKMTELAELGITSVIVNGIKPERLYNALNGKTIEGTTIHV